MLDGWHILAFSSTNFLTDGDRTSTDKNLDAGRPALILPFNSGAVDLELWQRERITQHCKATVKLWVVSVGDIDRAEDRSILFITYRWMTLASCDSLYILYSNSDQVISPCTDRPFFDAWRCVSRCDQSDLNHAHTCVKFTPFTEERVYKSTVNFLM